MSQQQWSARACPTFRRELADAYQARADRIRAMTGPHLPDWMLADGQRTIEADERAAWELRGIDLYWITTDMARLAMDAALDMPEFDARQLCPHPGIPSGGSNSSRVQALVASIICCAVDSRCQVNRTRCRPRRGGGRRPANSAPPRRR